MYALPAFTTLNVSAGRPLVSWPGFRRGMQVSASVSTFAESVGVDAGRKALSLYEILQVKRTASQTEIKTAYRRLAKLYHPDAIHDEAQSNGLEFIEIHNAYETLTDPARRSLYDLSLNYYQGRRRRPGGLSGGYKPTRRWETDQCW